MFPLLLLGLLVLALAAPTPKPRRQLLRLTRPAPRAPLPVSRADVGAEVDAEVEALTAPSKSPIEGITPAQWSSFVAWARELAEHAGPATVRVSASGGAVEPTFGLFQLGVRTLGHMGIMKNIRRVMVSGAPAWTGEFATPAARALWESDPGGQLRAFASHVAQHAAAIRARHAGAIGKPIAGAGQGAAPATLSGLLAVARVAGLGGLGKWLASADKRKPETSAAFEQANGLF